MDEWKRLVLESDRSGLEKTLKEYAVTEEFIKEMSDSSKLSSEELVGRLLLISLLVSEHELLLPMVTDLLGLVFSTESDNLEMVSLVQTAIRQLCGAISLIAERTNEDNSNVAIRKLVGFLLGPLISTSSLMDHAGISLSVFQLVSTYLQRVADIHQSSRSLSIALVDRFLSKFMSTEEEACTSPSVVLGVTTMLGHLALEKSVLVPRIVTVLVSLSERVGTHRKWTDNQKAFVRNSLEKQLARLLELDDKEIYSSLIVETIQKLVVDGGSSSRKIKGRVTSASASAEGSSLADEEDAAVMRDIGKERVAVSTELVDITRISLGHATEIIMNALPLLQLSVVPRALEKWRSLAGTVQTSSAESVVEVDDKKGSSSGASGIEMEEPFELFPRSLTLELVNDALTMSFKHLLADTARILEENDTRQEVSLDLKETSEDLNMKSTTTGSVKTRHQLVLRLGALLDIGIVDGFQVGHSLLMDFCFHDLNSRSMLLVQWLCLLWIRQSCLSNSDYVDSSGSASGEIMAGGQYEKAYVQVMERLAAMMVEGVSDWHRHLLLLLTRAPMLIGDLHESILRDALKNASDVDLRHAAISVMETLIFYRPNIRLSLLHSVCLGICLGPFATTTSTLDNMQDDASVSDMANGDTSKQDKKQYGTQDNMQDIAKTNATELTAEQKQEKRAEDALRRAVVALVVDHFYCKTNDLEVQAPILSAAKHALLEASNWCNRIGQLHSMDSNGLLDDEAMQQPHYHRKEFYGQFLDLGARLFMRRPLDLLDVFLQILEKDPSGTMRSLSTQHQVGEEAMEREDGEANSTVMIMSPLMEYLSGQVNHLVSSTSGVEIDPLALCRELATSTALDQALVQHAAVRLFLKRIVDAFSRAGYFSASTKVASETDTSINTDGSSSNTMDSTSVTQFKQQDQGTDLLTMVLEKIRLGQWPGVLLESVIQHVDRSMLLSTSIVKDGKACDLPADYSANVLINRYMSEVIPTASSVSTASCYSKMAEVMGPAELLIHIHSLECPHWCDSLQSSCCLHGGPSGVGLKRALEAMQLCFQMTGVFRPEVIARAVKSLIVKERSFEPRFPTLLLRTMIQLLSTYRSIIAPFIVAMMKELAHRSVHQFPKLWDGFGRLLKLLGAAAWEVCDVLDSDQVQLLQQNFDQIYQSWQSHLLQSKRRRVDDSTR